MCYMQIYGSADGTYSMCVLHVQMCGAADWLGSAVENTTSYTPFNGAYMHYFWAFPDPDTGVLLAKAAQLQIMMADHTTYFYPYDNLATDPDPGGGLHVLACLW